MGDGSAEEREEEKIVLTATIVFNRNRFIISKSNSISGKMQLYNTLSRRKEEFMPADGKNVSMYVCGITPYDTTHIGHAATYAVFDVLKRYLEFKGFGVNYVQNITDVDDPLFNRARRDNAAWKEVAEQNIEQYLSDLKKLNIQKPDCMPRGSDGIKDVVCAVLELMRKGHTYNKGGTVYFRTSSIPSYGSLSLLSRKEMIRMSAERGADPNDANKENPLDFVLWKKSLQDEPEWHAPWGNGRPGWHIECSVLSAKYLSVPIDIHGGGHDLVFPHHESEIAQSEAYLGHEPFSRFWMHTAMVNYKGEKISKSKNNLVFVRDALRTNSPNALRLYLHSHHYRESWDYDEDELSDFQQFSGLLWKAQKVKSGNSSPPNVSSFESRFIDALEDDLDTPKALSALEDMTSLILYCAGLGQDVSQAQKKLSSLSSILGIHF